MELTQETLLKISKIIDRLKINFPMISTPNSKSDLEFEKDKMKEWVNCLKEIDLDMCNRAIDKLITENQEAEIQNLIERPLAELITLTKSIQDKTMKDKYKYLADKNLIVRALRVAIKSDDNYDFVEFENVSTGNYVEEIFKVNDSDTYIGQDGRTYHYTRRVAMKIPVGKCKWYKSIPEQKPTELPLNEYLKMGERVYKR